MKVAACIEDTLSRVLQTEIDGNERLVGLIYLVSILVMMRWIVEVVSTIFVIVVLLAIGPRRQAKWPEFSGIICTPAL